jgi:hypothetical protein
MRQTYARISRFLLVAALAVGVLTLLQGAGARAQAEEAPEGTVLTVVPGPGAEPVHFTDADLAALPTVTFATGTIWTEEVHEFSGPSLATVMAAAGIPEGALQVRLTALNHYSVQIELSQVEDDAPIVANRIDGAAFSVRDKGPLWIVFPYDSEARFRSETVFALSVWQLRHIEAF